jgi:hypothetical protein
MKRVLLLIVAFCGTQTFLSAQTGIYQQGTVVRMRMGECLASQRGFMASLSGNAAPQGEELCPEYTLVGEQVVYVIVGKTSNQLIPLAEDIDFRFKNNELMVRVDDAHHEARFAVREMTLRSTWEHERRDVEEETSAPAHRRPHESAMVAGASR